MQVISWPKKIPFSFPWCHTGQVFQISAQFLFQTWEVYEVYYQIWLLSEEKYINLICIITHFRDRHFTIILWPQCSLGTSTLEHLSTASSCHTGNQAKNNIYTDAMATLSQRKWAYAHRLCIRNGWRRQRTNRKPFSNNGCTLRQNTFNLSRAEPMLSSYYIYINVDVCTLFKTKIPESQNHTFRCLKYSSWKSFLFALCGLLKVM